MTREEAMKELSYIIDEMPSECADWHDAISLAIKALQQEPCTDAISRQAVAEVLLKYAHSAEGKAFAEFLISQINDLPPVKSAEKVRWWRYYENMLTCPECGAEYYDEIMHYCGDDVPKYCPSCGCKMTASPTGKEVEE